MSTNTANPTVPKVADQSAVPSSYKLTEIGVIPIGWDAVQIGELFTFKNGLNKAKEFFGYGTPIVNYMDVFDHPGLYAGDIHGCVSLSRQEIDRFDVKAGDVFFTRTSETVDEIGTASVLLEDLEDGVFSGFVLRGRPVDNRLTLSFKKYCFANSVVRSQIVSTATYTTRALTNGRLLSRVWVAVPPRNEQDMIAEALSDVDGLIGALEKLIAKKRAIKQATLQQLLTGKTRLPGFSSKWTTVRLGDLGSFSKGRGIKRDDVTDEGLACIRYGELYTKYHNYLLVPKSLIPPDIAATALPIRKGDLLFAGSGETAEEIGRCAAYLGDDLAHAGGDIIVMTPRGHDSTYLGHLMNHPVVAIQKARLGQGDAVVHINARHLAQVEVTVPPQKEQSAIANVLLDMDAEIDALEQRRDKTKQIKQGMMQQLLTGRIRLVDPNPKRRSINESNGGEAP
ncbi:restriction endonuclease subunit S [bacterium]|nr:restriction endonuclease subunit S [bacterium]